MRTFFAIFFLLLALGIMVLTWFRIETMLNAQETMHRLKNAFSGPGGKQLKAGLNAEMYSEIFKNFALISLCVFASYKLKKEA